MPLLGSDTLLATSIKQMIIQQNAAEGLAAPEPRALDAMATGIAKAVIAHFIANAQVLPGIPVVTATGAGSTAGPGVLT